MRNYVNVGPMSLRVSTKGIARWGYPLLRIGGLTLLSRSSNGSLVLASYHPIGDGCWHWSVSIGERNGNRMVCRSPFRRGQWHDFYNLGRFGLCVSRQDYHKRG